MFIFKVFSCPVCSLSTFSVDFCIDKAECHYMSKVNNGNHRRRDEFHFLIEKGMVIHLAGLELSNLKNIYYSIISSFETESFLFKTFPVGTCRA